METWFSIEPLKGYVCKSDFTRIEENLKQIYKSNVKLIKKQRFILVIITNHSYTSTYDIYKYLVGLNFKKTYDIEKITDSQGRLTTKVLPKRTIGLPY